MSIPFSVSSEAGAIVRPGVLALERVTVLARDERLDALLTAAARALRAEAPSETTTRAVRAMYRAFGIDPTKTRPSSEALLRRVRRGEPLPRINSAVDIGNWCSVETQLPYGLYDLARVTGAIELRHGRPGEEYPGIGKDVVHVGGRLTVADDEGPFGNPTSDSARTMVGTTTHTLLVVIYAPAALAAEETQRALRLTESRLLQFAGGEVVGRYGYPK